MKEFVLLILLITILSAIITTSTLLLIKVVVRIFENDIISIAIVTTFVIMASMVGINVVNMIL